MPCPGCGHELTTVGCVNQKCPDNLPAKWGCSESGFGHSRDHAAVERVRIVKIVTEVLDDYDDGALILAEILPRIG